jgi:hypothetical protein
MTTQTTAAPADTDGIWLDVLTAVANDRVRSLYADDLSDIHEYWPDGSSRCITGRVLPLAGAGYIRRVPGRSAWELTDAGQAELGAAQGETGGS